jgi:hypothetical protein
VIRGRWSVSDHASENQFSGFMPSVLDHRFGWANRARLLFT